MFRKVLILGAIVTTFPFCYCVEAGAMSASWDGGGDGYSWGDPYNWDPNIVPDNNGNTFSVSINGGISGVEVRLQQNRTINSLHCYGVVDLESSRWYLPDLTVQSGLTNHGSLDLELDIRGNVTNTAGGELDLGKHLNIYGNLYNNLGATITIFPDDIDVEGGTVQNDGLILAYKGGSIGEALQLQNAGEIRLFGGGCHATAFHNNSEGTIEGFGWISSEELTQNRGTIRASLGTLLLYSEGSITNSGILKNDVGATLHAADGVEGPIADLNNQGTVEVSAGGSITFDCNLVNETNGVIELHGGTLAATSITQAADANFAGFGGITGDVFINPNGIIELTGPTNIVGDVNIPANATLEISDGTTLITGQTICNNGTIHMIGGRIICQGGLTNNNCNIIWEPGTYTNLADFNLDGTVNFKDFADFANTWLWQASWY